MEYYMRILRELREDSDKTQTEIAKILGVTQTYYARYENDRCTLPIRHLIKLCEYYNVSADYILGLGYGRNHPRHK